MTPTGADAIESVARDALLDLTTAATVGEVIARRVDEDGTVTLDFAATVSGYPGWHWSVTLAQLPGEEPTVLESELLPGEGALLAPDWVPWAQRLEEYRAAQAAALAAGEEIDDELGLAQDADADDLDEDEDEDDLDDEADDDDLDDEFDDPDDDDADDDEDEFDETDDLDEASGPAADVHVDEQDEAEAEADEARPEEVEEPVGGESVEGRE